MAADGVRAQTCVTSPPYFGLRDYGHAGQIGLEQTPDAYITSMVEVFRCVRDVLADDGTLWLNIGDTYAGQGGRGVMSGKEFESRARGRQEICRSARVKPAGDVKTKDLIGIPWLLAFALRADGWYLRQEIIWHKPNPMPESVTDRCTKAHESIFLLAKSERYFFDSEAIKEPAVSEKPAGNKRHRGADAYVAGDGFHRTKGGLTALAGVEWEKRNRRSVWTIATRPYRGAHFATFPPALVEPCILAGSRVGDIVLDPFMGSGTTAEVALRLGRDYRGCEINRDYAPLQQARIEAAVAAEFL